MKVFCFLLTILILTTAAGEQDESVKPAIQNTMENRDELGDVNQDGERNIADVYIIVGMIMGHITPTDYMIWAADMNQDGTYDIIDVLTLVDIILNEDTLPPNYFINFAGDGSYVDLDMVGISLPWTIECDVSKNENIPFSHLLTDSDGGSGIRLEQWYNNNEVGITDYGVMDYYFGYELPAGIWEHLAVTSDGNQTKLLIDPKHTSCQEL